MLKKLFNLKGSLDSKTFLALELAGIALLLFFWVLITMGENPVANTAILPKPGDVFSSYGEMLKENNLIQNIFRSLGLNIAGYIEAILIALPIGFVIGLFPIFRGLFRRQVDAIRYIPLTAVTGIFIAAFGLGISMKVHFLAFGILIYLLPVVVQRIDEVKEVYVKTVYTLGATDWQTIRSVYLPSVMSRISDDIRVLTAISWTYIIVAESLGNFGGIGGLIWRAGIRQGRMDKVYALLVVIMIFGILQDKIFTHLDRRFFAHKFQGKSKYDTVDKKNTTLIQNLMAFIGLASFWIGISIYVILLINEFVPFFGDFKPLSYLFGDTVWVIHLIVLSTLAYSIYQIWYRKKYPYLYE